MRKRKGRFPLLPLLLCLVPLSLGLGTEKKDSLSFSSPAFRVGSHMQLGKEAALQGLTSFRKTYHLDENALAPEPDARCYDILYSAEEVLALFDRAAALLNGREPLFCADTPFDTERGVRCYCDESILVLVWYQQVEEAGRPVYHPATMAEIFLADGSQFRRALSGDSFGSELLKYPTDMATEVNAVFASSGDFYRYRGEGFCVWNAELCRLRADKVDSCAVDSRGELLFIPAGSLQSEEEARAYIAEHDVRFTLSFGPILVENHESVHPDFYYDVGEAHERFPRLILSQWGELHYVEMAVKDQLTVFEAGDILKVMGAERCYALDGGQTATLVMEGTALNPGLYGEGNGAQRTQSDIIYFASAIR